MRITIYTVAAISNPFGSNCVMLRTGLRIFTQFGMMRAQSQFFQQYIYLFL